MLKYIQGISGYTGDEIFIIVLLFSTGTFITSAVVEWYNNKKRKNKIEIADEIIGDLIAGLLNGLHQELIGPRYNSLLGKNIFISLFTVRGRVFKYLKRERTVGYCNKTIDNWTKINHFQLKHTSTGRCFLSEEDKVEIIDFTKVKYEKFKGLPKDLFNFSKNHTKYRLTIPIFAYDSIILLISINCLDLSLNWNIQEINMGKNPVFNDVVTKINATGSQLTNHYEYLCLGD